MLHGRILRPQCDILDMPHCQTDIEPLEAGALMSYGPNYFESYKAAAIYVDKILKGDSPADLPIDQSSRFEFVVNMKTAKMLGLEIPASVLGFASEMIE